MSRAVGQAVLPAVLACLLAAGALAAQEPRPDSAAPPPPRPTTGGWGAADVAPRAGSSVVSVTVAFPRGSAGDPEGASGSTRLLGRVVREVALANLDPAARTSTEIAVEVERSRTLFRMVALPRYWVEAYGVLEWALFGAALPDSATERVRAEMARVFLFEDDAPHREFEVELYRLLGGSGSPWSRAPRGDMAGIAALDPEELTVFRGRTFQKADAAVSVVGAVDPEQAARTVTGGPALPATGTLGPAFTPLDAREGAPEPWDEGSRVELAREVTSSWVAVAFPVDPGTSQTALDMLMYRLERAFNPSPPDPGTFDVSVRLELMGTTDLLIVEAAVLQEAATQWERRILVAVSAIAGDEMAGAYFAASLRRFRSHRLLRDAPPEDESARRALDLLFHGAVRHLVAEIAELVPDDLQEAADELGEPRIFVFGPDFGEGSTW